MTPPAPDGATERRRIVANLRQAARLLDPNASAASGVLIALAMAIEVGAEDFLAIGASIERMVRQHPNDV